MTILPAGIADIQTVHQLAHEIWPQAYGSILSPAQLEYMLKLIYSPDALREQIQNKKHCFILLNDQTVSVGFASFSPKTNNDPSIFRLHKIYVLPSQQGKGSGQLLLNYVIKESSAAGARSLELNVNRHNKALRFYEKNGFHIVHEEDIDIGNGYFMNDYVMEKTL